MYVVFNVPSLTLLLISTAHTTLWFLPVLPVRLAAPEEAQRKERNRVRLGVAGVFKINATHSCSTVFVYAQIRCPFFALGLTLTFSNTVHSELLSSRRRHNVGTEIGIIRSVSWPRSSLKMRRSITLSQIAVCVSEHCNLWAGGSAGAAWYSWWYAPCECTNTLFFCFRDTRNEKEGSIEENPLFSIIGVKPSYFVALFWSCRRLASACTLLEEIMINFTLLYWAADNLIMKNSGAMSGLCVMWDV